jgi:hypothetical protein
MDFIPTLMRIYPIPLPTVADCRQLLLTDALVMACRRHAYFRPTAGLRERQLDGDPISSPKSPSRSPRTMQFSRSVPGIRRTSESCLEITAPNMISANRVSQDTRVLTSSPGAFGKCVTGALIQGSLPRSLGTLFSPSQALSESKISSDVAQ